MPNSRSIIDHAVDRLPGAIEVILRAFCDHHMGVGRGLVRVHLPQMNMVDPGHALDGAKRRDHRFTDQIGRAWPA